MAKQQQTTPTPTLTRPKQTAAHFKVSHMTLHRWSKQKDFPQPLKRGAIVLHDIAAITAWLAGGNAE